MNVIDSYAAEIKELEEILSAMPEEYAIERLSIEARIRNAKDSVSNLTHPGEPSKK
jgi:hypothetical protein